MFLETFETFLLNEHVDSSCKGSKSTKEIIKTESKILQPQLNP